MSTLDLRVGRLDLHGNPGTGETVVATWLDENGDPYDLSAYTVTLWIGGTDSDLEDFTGATEVEASTVVNVATFAFVAPDVRSLVRLTVDGVLMAIGTYHLSKRGTQDNAQAVTVQLDSASLALSFAGPPGATGGTFFLDDEGYVTAIVPSPDDSLTIDGDGLVLLTIGD